MAVAAAVAVAVSGGLVGGAPAWQPNFTLGER
jgi:hypothetical protein